MDESDETAPDELAGPPAEIFELAENCRAFAMRAVGVELDYEPETLPVLDLYLEIARKSFEERPELEALLVRTMAAYFGEVTRRVLDGFWLDSSADVHRWQLCFRQAFMSVNPAGLVQDVLNRGEERPGPDVSLRFDAGDEAYVVERLERIPAMPDDDYYRLTTRLEALQIAYEAVRDKMRSEGVEGVTYGAEDYRDLEGDGFPN